MITYQDVVLNTFVFFENKMDDYFYNHIWNIEIPDTGYSHNDIRYKLKNINLETKNIITSYIKKFPLENTILNFIETFDFEINKMIKGDSIPRHCETSQKSPIEILIWLTKNEPFEGRDFYYEKNGLHNKVKPYTGLNCLIDTTCPNAYHGVSPLLSDTEIITIVGGQGRK
jgi:hypothetical protein